MRMPVLALAAVLPFALGCNASPHSQDQVRRETAAATATVASDIKGAALGIRDGLHQQHDANRSGSDSVDLNTATRTTLETLPGITPALSKSIVAHRPYAGPVDLRRRHIVPPAEYDRISPRLTASN